MSMIESAVKGSALISNLGGIAHLEHNGFSVMLSASKLATTFNNLSAQFNAGNIVGRSKNGVEYFKSRTFRESSIVIDSEEDQEERDNKLLQKLLMAKFEKMATALIKGSKTENVNTINFNISFNNYNISGNNNMLGDYSVQINYTQSNE